MDSLKTEIILAGLADIAGQLSWYEDIAIEKGNLKDMERIKALKDEALELSKNIRINGTDSISDLEEKYREIRNVYEVYFKKYNQIMPEFVKQFGRHLEA